MAVQSLTNVTTFVHGYDFTGDTNEVALGVEAATKDVTTFGSSGWEECIAGLKSGSVEVKGLWQAGTSSVDAESFPDLGVADRVVTLAPTGVAGDVAYLAKLGKFAYVPFSGSIGDVAGFTLGCKSTNSVGILRGYLAKAKGNVSATGALGSGVNAGAVSATQYVYGSLHVFSAGTTITVVLESDDNSGFTSATTVATLGPITTTGGTWATRAAGPITDTYFRYRVTAITGTFSVAAAIAVA